MSTPAESILLRTSIDPEARRTPSPVSYWVDRRFDVYARACLVTAMFVAPLIVDDRKITLIKLTVLWVFGICAVAFSLSAAAERRSWLPRTLTGYAAVAFVVSIGLSTIFSLSPSQSLLGIDQRNIGFLTMLLGVAFMFVVLALYHKRPDRLAEVAWAIGGSATVVGGYVLIQAAGLDWNSWTIRGKESEFPIGTMGNSNFAGGYLAIAIPLAFYALLVTLRRYRNCVVQAAAGMSFGITLLGLCFTRHRGGMLALLAAFVVMALLAGRRLPRWICRAAKAVALVAVLSLLLIVWHPGLGHAPGPLREMSTSTLVNRAYLWQAGWEIFIDHPVVGTGPDTYYAYYPTYRPRAEALKNPFEMADEPHSIFVSHASNSGFLGIGSYLVLISITLWFGARQLRRSQTPHDLLLISLYGSFVAYLVQGFFSMDLPLLAVTGWVLVGGITCLSDPGMLRAREQSESLAPNGSAKARRLRWPVHVVVAMIAIALVVVGIRPFRADIRARRGDTQSAMRLNPLAADIPRQAANLAKRLATNAKDPDVRRERLEEADSYFRKALDLHPREPNYLLELALLNTYWAEIVEPSRFEVAERWWRKVVATDPHGVIFRPQYEQARVRIRNVAGKLEQLALARPDDSQGWVSAGKAYVAIGDIAKARMLLQRSLEITPDNREARELLARVR